MDLIFEVFAKKWREFLISCAVLLLAGWGLILTFKSANAAASQDPSPKPVVITSPSPLALPSPSVSPNPSTEPSPSPSAEPSQTPSPTPSATPEGTSSASKGGTNADVNQMPTSGPETWALVWSLAAIPGGLTLSGFRKGRFLKAEKQRENMAKVAKELVDSRINSR